MLAGFIFFPAFFFLYKINFFSKLKDEQQK